MIAACATLGTVTDHGRSPFPDSPARHSGDAQTPVSLTADELVAVTGGTLLHRSERPIRGGAVDSRLVAPDALFVALPGERTDGHRFLDAAVAAGASALLVGRRPAADETPLDALGDVPSSSSRTRSGRSTRSPERGAAGSPRSWWGSPGASPRRPPRRRSPPSWVERFTTLRTEGNQNNEVGMPLTVLRLGPEHEAAVLEMGMYVGGEIRDLAAIGLPSIGIVTAVQPVHLSRIGTLDAIVDAKAELVEALPARDEGGVAILNADDPRVAAMASRTRAAVTTYGFADARGRPGVGRRVAGPGRDALPAADAGGERDVAIPTLGRMAVHNALAATAAGLAAGMTLDDILPGLMAGSSAPHRSTVVRAGGVVIVDDSYNASPGSVRAALELLAGIPGRPIAVLGEMRELGAAHDAGHHEVGEAAGETVDLLVVVDGGPDGAAAGIVDGARAAGLAPDRVIAVEDAAAAVDLLRTTLAPGDVVLVKASRGVALERVVEGLVEALGGPEAAP